MKKICIIVLILCSLYPFTSCYEVKESSSSLFVTLLVDHDKFDYEYTMHVGESKRFSVLGWSSSDLIGLDPVTIEKMKDTNNIVYDHAIGTNVDKVTIEPDLRTFFSTVTINEDFNDPIVITGIVFKIKDSFYKVRLNGNLTIHKDRDYSDKTPIFPTSYVEKMIDIGSQNAVKKVTEDGGHSFWIPLSDIGINAEDRINTFTIKSLQLSENEYYRLVNIKYAILKSTGMAPRPLNYFDDLMDLTEDGVTMSYETSPMGIIFYFTIEIIKPKDYYFGFGRDIEFHVESNNVSSILYREILLP